MRATFGMWFYLEQPDSLESGSLVVCAILCASVAWPGGLLGFLASSHLTWTPPKHVILAFSSNDSPGTVSSSWLYKAGRRPFQPFRLVFLYPAIIESLKLVRSHSLGLFFSLVAGLIASQVGCASLHERAAREDGLARLTGHPGLPTRAKIKGVPCQCYAVRWYM